jgi:formylglycine-generating enzyme required for sulfatase activity
MMTTIVIVWLLGSGLAAAAFLLWPSKAPRAGAISLSAVVTLAAALVSDRLRAGLVALALGTAMAAQAAAPVITNPTAVGSAPRFGIVSGLGVTNQIQSCTNLNQTNWSVVTNVWVTESPYWFTDVAVAPAAQRFYRVAALPFPPPPSGLTLIAAGGFVMGDSLDSDVNAQPTHGVYVNAFRIETNLVSYTLWRQVCQWATNHGYNFDSAGSAKGATHPVQTISWYDCVKWCNARSEWEGRAPAYFTDAGQTTVYRTGRVDVAGSGVNWSGGYRLPTEAEWEKASRGGASGYRFPWSDSYNIDWSRANYQSSQNFSYDVNPIHGYDTNFTGGGFPYTSPVGSFAPNGYGLYDMAGNVSEWCWDWYGAYSSAPVTDPRGPATGTSRVRRSGSWNDYADGLRCAYRATGTPAGASFVLGFRCARGQ